MNAWASAGAGTCAIPYVAPFIVIWATSDCKITSSKTPAGLENACESCADSAATVNVHRLRHIGPRG